MKSLFCRAMVILSRFGREVTGEEKGPIASCLCLIDFYQYVAFEESVLKSLNDSELKMGPVSPRDVTYILNCQHDWPYTIHLGHPAIENLLSIQNSRVK